MKEKEIPVIGSIMKKKGSQDDGSCYIFLGLVEKEHLDVEKIMKSITGVSRKRLGWFTPFPLKLSLRCTESEIPVYAWFIDMFERQ